MGGRLGCIRGVRVGRLGLGIFPAIASRRRGLVLLGVSLLPGDDIIAESGDMILDSFGRLGVQKFDGIDQRGSDLGHNHRPLLFASVAFGPDHGSAKLAAGRVHAGDDGDLGILVGHEATVLYRCVQSAVLQSLDKAKHADLSGWTGGPCVAREEP